MELASVRSTVEGSTVSSQQHDVGPWLKWMMNKVHTTPERLEERHTNPWFVLFLSTCYPWLNVASMVCSSECLVQLRESLSCWILHANVALATTAFYSVECQGGRCRYGFWAGGHVGILYGTSLLVSMASTFSYHQFCFATRRPKSRRWL